MTRVAMCLVSLAILLGGMLISPGFAQVDLVIEATDISMAKNTPLNTTYVTATVHNNGGAVSGAFTLRVGVSTAASSATSDFVVSGLAPGLTTSRTATFTGTDWACGWANADVAAVVTETNEGNNCANKNDYWMAIMPGGTLNEQIGVVNPGLNNETALLTVDAPPDWIAAVNPAVLALGPGELATVLLHIGAPSSFEDYEIVEVYCNFQDGTPGVMDWKLHMESTIPADQSTWGRVKALFGD